MQPQFNKRKLLLVKVLFTQNRLTWLDHFKRMKFLMIHFLQRNSSILFSCALAFTLTGCDWWHSNGDPADVTPPTISLVGENPQTIEVGTAYTELGATATDDNDGNITSSIVIDDSGVDTNTVGSYTVTYNVSDEAGNAATTVTRTVEVVADATPPVIILTGDNPQVIEYGDAYTEFGATATDNIDGDITANIVTDASAVDTSSLGSYTVTYDVSDAAGNAATQISRIVNVVDTTAPVITLTGDNPQSIALNDTYTELGATATDNVDGDLTVNIVIDSSAVDVSIVGSYTVTYDVSDASGNAASTVTRTVNVGEGSGADAPVFIAADDGTTGIELWKSDGTASGTVLVKDITPGTDHAYPESFEMVGTTLFFVYSATETGRELWKSDGTADGTVMVKDIYPGADDGNPRYLTNVNGILFFIAYDGTGVELWKSDGTEAGTVMVKDIYDGGSSDPKELTTVNNILMFTAQDGINGRELWKSDGTEAGTVMVKDIYTGSYSSYIKELANVGGTLFFRAMDASGLYGDELWKSDGTLAGTMMVKDIYTGAGSSGLYNIIDANGTAFFLADDGTHGVELWVSDGTEAGTMLVKDVNPGIESGALRPYHVADGTVAFVGNDGTNGGELWRSDGTEDSTYMVKDIFPGSEWSSPAEFAFVPAENMLVFRAFSPDSAIEIWASDGTEDGTFLLKDLSPGTASSGINIEYWSNQERPLILDNGKLLFGARVDGTGWELYITDGTTTGTFLVKDINPGSADGLWVD